MAPNHERHDVITRALRENYANITQQVTMLPPSTGLSRETNDNFQELCNTFADGILSRNPRELMDPQTNDNFQELCNTFSDGILSRNPRELTLFV